MEEGSKRRLVGTAVVVLLLVIFLPMLLEEEPVNPVPDSDLGIPARPPLEPGATPEPTDGPAETFVLPTAPELPPPDSYQPQPSESDQPVLPEPAAAQPAAAPEPVASLPEIREPAPSPPPVSTTVPQAVPVQTPPPRQSQPEPRPQDGPGWVVQVSSLTEEPRARKLERELIEKGFPAFIEKAEVGGKIYHRVRVGPRSERTDINAMASSLSEKTGYKGQILRYP